MHEQLQRVLYGLVRQYIDTAEPVSSTYLKRVLKLGVSPATVRSWLQSLEEEGFIEQPHTSAGRIPTDQGYRFYVNHIHSHSSHRRPPAATSPQSLVRRLSRQAHTLAAAGLPNGRVEQYGLVEVMVQPEGKSRAAVHEISTFLDHIHEFVEQFIENANARNTHVFIGQENPFMPAEHTSVVMRCVENHQGRRSVVLLLGPKRMAYSRNIALLEHLGMILDNSYE